MKTSKAVGFWQTISEKNNDPTRFLASHNITINQSAITLAQKLKKQLDVHYAHAEIEMKEAICSQFQNNALDQIDPIAVVDILEGADKKQQQAEQSAIEQVMQALDTNEIAQLRTPIAVNGVTIDTDYRQMAIEEPQFFLELVQGRCERYEQIKNGEFNPHEFSASHSQSNQSDIHIEILKEK